MTRTDVLQAIIDQRLARAYLEIGVEHGQNFFPIRCWKKVAVDPDFEFSKLGRLRWSLVNPCNARATFFRGTSDSYFGSCREPHFDVAFIDGLHTFEQTLRDIESALGRLKEGGVIVVHDCNPPNASAAEPAETPGRAATLGQQSWTGAWCGEVWKVVVHLRSTREDLQVFVLGCDYGLGIIRRGTSARPLDLDGEQVGSMTYADLEKDRNSLLDLRAESELDEFLSTL